MAEERHFLEVGSDDVPSRARPERAAADNDKQTGVVPSTDATPCLDGEPKTIAESETKSADITQLVNADFAAGYDQTSAFVGIDYKGDREESDWRSVGERLGGLMWSLLIFVAIIVWFIVQLFTCERFPVYIINP